MRLLMTSLSLGSSVLISLAILPIVFGSAHEKVHLHRDQFHHVEHALSAGSDGRMIHNPYVLGVTVATLLNSEPTSTFRSASDRLLETAAVETYGPVATADTFLELKIRAVEATVLETSTKLHHHAQHHEHTGSLDHQPTYEESFSYIRPIYIEVDQAKNTDSPVSLIGRVAAYSAEPLHLDPRNHNNLYQLNTRKIQSVKDGATDVASFDNTLDKLHHREVNVAREATGQPSALPSSSCPSSNGTIFTSAGGMKYQKICGMNIPGQDLPFQQVDSYEACVAACDTTTGDSPCLAMIFVPSRISDADDCYLKYATGNLTPTDTPVEGAILITSGRSAAVLTSRAPSSVSTAFGPAVTYARGNSVIAPRIAFQKLHGPTQNHPSTQYIKYQAPADLTLSKNLLTVGVNGGLTTNYGISLDTGVLQVNASTEHLLMNLNEAPHLSRDGGKGGMLNGQHMFVFCDTGAYSPSTPNRNGNFLGFVSSSVATDTGMNALYGNPIYLEDGIGQWSDDAGRLRGFSPITQGEMGYNLVMQGRGQRYAVWPESSIIPLSGNTAILYAPIIYDNVNEVTRAAVFTYSGNTLLTVTAGGQEGPVAQRTVNRLFNEGEVEWGCVGGIRSWGSDGIGGTEGKVYLFGNVAGGILLARTDPDSVADRNSYEYWTGNSWSHGMQASDSKAYFIAGAFMDVDVFYSPRHLTFIIVYMNIYADSTFYYRYLQASQAIRPSYAGGIQSADYVENILQHPWSPEQVLYKSSPGLTGRYTYAGGVHQGYFYADDITNGGRKMLLSWTAPTGQDPASVNSEYQIVTAEIDWA